MQLNMQKRLAARILKTSEKNIQLETTRLEEIKEAITKTDIKSLIKDKAIKEKKPNQGSRARSKRLKIQRSKGRRKGLGSKKGTTNAKISKKRRWMHHIRIQREFLRNLRDKEIINPQIYRSMYLKSKGGFFRSKRHLKIYMIEHGMLKNENIK